MAATEITVTATYKRTDGTPASGTVSFELSGTLMDTSGNVLYPSVKRIEKLGSDGSLSVTLPATKGDLTTAPTGLTYTVRESLVGAAEQSYKIELDTDLGLTQDLADIAPAVNVTTNTYALVSALNTHVAATENVHGISDTAQLATLSDLAGTASTVTDLSQRNQATFGEASITDGVLALTFRTNWGIDGNGNPYYNDAGATAGDEAALIIGTDGSLNLVTVGG